MTRDQGGAASTSGRSSTSLRTSTLSERVLQELRSRLSRGLLVPGQRVGVDALAAEFEISPLPVREAMRALLAEGRVEYSPNKGFRVTKLTLADVQEMFLICRLLEIEALRRGVPAMDDASVTRMRELLEELDALPEDTNAWEQAMVHQDFHFAPMEQAGLPRLQAELRRLWSHTDHYRALYVFRDAAARDVLQRDHWKFFRACERRDGQRAVELMNEHRDHAIDCLIRGFVEAGEEPSHGGTTVVGT